MSLPTGAGRPLGQDPTAAYPTAPRPDVPVASRVDVPSASRVDLPRAPRPGAPAGRDVPPRGHVPRAGAGYAPSAAGRAGAPAAAAAAVPLTLRDRDDRAGDASRRRRTPPLAWLPWALLAALLVLLALMLLAGALAGPDRETAAGGAVGVAAGAGAPGTGTGTLQVGDVDVLADRAGLGRLAALQGRPAVGRGVLVESVVADEGFWVGSSAAQRTFVFLTPQARQSAGESGFQVEKGRRIDLNGTVTATSEGDAARLGVTDAEGARQLTQQRAYVRATQVRLLAS